MMSTLCASCLVLSLGLQLQSEEMATRADLNPRKQLAEAVGRFMASNSDLHPDDLIVHSDVLELQEYLVRTHREGPLTSPRVLHHVLEDRSALSRLYHRRGGDALRTAAEALGSYEPLNQLARKGNGRKVLRDAIDSGSVVELLRTIEALGDEQGVRNQSSMVYTTRDLVRRYLGADLAIIELSDK